MDDFEKSKNDHNPPYLNLSDSIEFPSHPMRSLASDTTLGNDLCPHPLSLQASEMLHDIDTEYDKDLDGNQQSLSKQGKMKLLLQTAY